MYLKVLLARSDFFQVHSFATASLTFQMSGDTDITSGTNLNDSISIQYKIRALYNFLTPTVHNKINTSPTS